MREGERKLRQILEEGSGITQDMAISFSRSLGDAWVLSDYVESQLTGMMSPPGRFSAVNGRAVVEPFLREIEDLLRQSPAGVPKELLAVYCEKIRGILSSD